MNSLLLICFLLINPIILLLPENNNFQYDYSTIKSVSKNTGLDSQTVTSKESDESVIYFSPEAEPNILITNSIINKESGDSSKIEDSDLYGLNAAILAQGKDTPIVSVIGGQITTNAKGANAVFGTNEASISTTSGLTITTNGISSRGLISTFKGSVAGNEISITTNGESSPALEMNEQGTSVCIGCTLNTNGKNSHLLNSKGANGGSINIENTKGTAQNSKIACLDGSNTISIKKNSEMKCGANPSKEDNDIDQSGIMLYQSGSRLLTGNTFGCEDSILEILSTSKYYSTAPMFFVTNNGAAIQLKNCQIKYGSNTFINLKSTDVWGEKGSNGGDATIYLTEQNIEGDFVIDGISTLNLILKKSTIKGTINGANTAKVVNINLDIDSKITITGNSYCSSMTNEIKDGSNLINETYKWTIGTTPDGPTGSAKYILGSSLGILYLCLILIILN